VALTNWRRPHSITLPGGFRIPIVYWSARKMASVKRRDPTLAKQDLLGYWDGARIVINDSEPCWMQIKVLAHEMVHAVHDWSLYLEQAFVEPIKMEVEESVVHLREDE